MHGIQVRTGRPYQALTRSAVWPYLLTYLTCSVYIAASRNKLVRCCRNWNVVTAARQQCAYASQPGWLRHRILTISIHCHSTVPLTDPPTGQHLHVLLNDPLDLLITLTYMQHIHVAIREISSNKDVKLRREADSKIPIHKLSVT